MTKLEEYFHTEWAEMTGVDWVGLIITVVLFLLMLGLYVFVLNPKNKDRLEQHRSMVMDDDTALEKKDV